MVLAKALITMLPSELLATIAMVVLEGLRVALTLYFRQKHHSGPYIIRSQLIWFLHFGNSQFNPCYFQVLVLNLVPTVNF